jgi:hypothetical protein
LEKSRTWSDLAALEPTRHARPDANRQPPPRLDTLDASESVGSSFDV